MISNTVVIRPCSHCGSSKFSLNREGFSVCNSCGILLEAPNFGKPSFDIENNMSSSRGHAIQTPTSRTSIGNSSERIHSPYSGLERRQMELGYTYEYRVHLDAKYEIHRICAALRLPDSFIHESLQVFDSTWKKVQKHTQARSVYSLVPVVLFRAAKMFGYSLSIRQLLPVIQINSKRFRKVLISTYHYFSRFSQQKSIIQCIKQVCTELEVNGQLFLTAMKIFHRERRILMQSTQNVAACAAVGLAIIALNKRTDYPILHLANIGGSSQAAITSRMFRVAVNRRLPIVKYKVKELEKFIPEYYRNILRSTNQFAPPVLRDTIQNIHRIANELKMPYRVKTRAIKLLKANRSVFLMTTRAICASSAVGLAVLTMGLRKKFSLHRVGKVLECSSSAISSRIFKVLHSRGFKTFYKICRLDEILLVEFKNLIGKK